MEMDYLSIQEDAIIEVSRMQRAAGLVRSLKVVEPTAEEIARAKQLKKESWQ